MKTNGKKIIAENHEDYIKLILNLKKLEDLRLTMCRLGKDFKCEKQYEWVRLAIVKYRKSIEFKEFLNLVYIDAQLDFDYNILNEGIYNKK